MRGEFIDLDDTRLYCFATGTRGAGEPIVLLHGAFTSSHIWRDLTSRLPKGHRVLVIDLLGHGRSDRPATADFGVRAHAARVTGVLDELGVEPACVVGHGLGAAIACAVAADAPHRVTRLLLCNPCHLTAGAATGSLPRAFRRLASTTWLWRRLPPDWFASALHAALVRGYANRLLAGHAMDVCLKAFRSEAGREVACRQLTALAGAGSALPLTPGLLGVPVGLMLGAEDPFVPQRGERLRLALPEAVTAPVTVHRLAGLSHAIPEEAPDRLAMAVAELLAQ